MFSLIFDFVVVVFGVGGGVLVGFIWVVVYFVWWWWTDLWVVMAIEQWWQFFPSSRSRFCVGGGGLCLSLAVVAGSWFMFPFSENRFFTTKIKHKK